jgi:hypothetical protein
MKFFLLLAVAALTGCTTLADARLAEGSGQKRTYNETYNKTWGAALCSLNANGLSIASENKSENTILAQRGITAFSYGENVATFVRKLSAEKTEVEVVSKKAMETNVFAPNWSKSVLDGVDSCLKRKG